MITRRKLGAILGALPVLSIIGTSAGANAAPKTHRVRITKFKFEPSDLVIAAGDKVVWTNEDFAPHTATEQGAAHWDTGELGRGDSGQIAFTEPGQHAYFCVFHPHMKGQISVL